MSAREVVPPRRRIISSLSRPPFGGRRSSCGSEGTRARAAPPGRWSRASPAAASSRAPRRAAYGCGRNDTRTGLRRKETHSTSTRSTPTWRLDYVSFRCATTRPRGRFCTARSRGHSPFLCQEFVQLAPAGQPPGFPRPLPRRASRALDAAGFRWGNLPVSPDPFPGALRAHRYAMGDRGFEPRTSALSERRSNQLS